MGIGGGRWRGRAWQGALVLAFCGLAALTLLAPAVLPVFGMDDTFITWIYARNLAEGAGLRYNAADAAPTEGFSSLLHVLVMAGTYLADRNLFAPALAIDMLSFLAVPIILGFGVRAAADVPLAVALTASVLLQAMLFLSRATATHLLSGMETLLFMACAAALASWSLVEIRRSFAGEATTPARAATGLAVLSLAVVSRPEGVLLGLLSVAVVLAVKWRRAGLRTLAADRRFTLLLGGYAFGLALWAAWKVWYFGSLLPNPYYVKVANRIFGSAGRTFPGLGDTLAFLRAYGPWFAAAAALLLAVPDVRRRWRETALVLLPAAFVVLGYTRAIHEQAHGHRYEYPFLAYAQAAVAYGACLAWRGMRRGGALFLALVPATLALVCLVSLKPADLRDPWGWLRWNTFRGAHARPAIDLARTGLGEGASLLTSAAGYVPYLSRFRTTDWIGLNTTYLSGRYRLDLDQVWTYIDAQKPDVIMSSFPPASPGSTRPEDDPAFQSFAIRLASTAGSSSLFVNWERRRWREMFHREMRYVREHYVFGCCYPYQLGLFTILYVRRDSPRRDRILSVLRTSRLADWGTDLRPQYINDPRALL